MSLNTPIIVATAYGPNNIILTWSPVTNPGWGYCVEVLCDTYESPWGEVDSRYSNWTQITWRNGLTYLPYWVTESGGTESSYTDPTTSNSGWGSPAQANIYGLRYGTTYSFRVRCYGQTDNNVAIYGDYSSIVSAKTTTPSTIRYVDSTVGSSGNGQSWGTAWKKIEEANNVTSGTLVLIKGGTYTLEQLQPTNNGGPGPGRIVLQANYGEVPTITSRSPGGMGVVIYMNTNFVVMDGIVTTSGVLLDSEPSIYLTGSRNVFANCKFQGALTTNWGLIFTYASGNYNLIHNCYLYECGNLQTQGNLVAFGTPGTDCTASVRNTAQYCYLTYGGHGSVEIYGGSSYNRVLNNFTTACGELMVGVSYTGYPASQYNLVEGNIITRTAMNTQTDRKPGIQNGGSNNTIRRNILYDGWQTSTPGNPDGSGGIEVSSLQNIIANNNLIYNNTMVHEGGPAFYLWGPTNTQIKNNIMYDMGLGIVDGDASTLSHLLSDAAAGDTNDVNKNLILDVTGGGAENPGATIITRAYGNSVTVSYANANYTDITGNYDDYSPNFIDYTGRELHLKSTSEVLGLGESIVDAVWGTLGQLDLGAYKYYEISADVSTAITVSRGVVKVNPFVSYGGGLSVF